MGDPTKPEIQLSKTIDSNVEYLLRELEFQVAIETRARDRMENMVQYILTTIAAVIGAALLVNEMQVNSVLLLFIASLLMFLFSTSFYYRACRLRYITTYARVTRNKIRCALRDLEIPEADQLIEWEGNPSGFGTRMMSKLNWLLALCCLLGGATSIFAILLVFHVTGLPIDLSSAELTILIFFSLIATVIIAYVLRVVLNSQKSKSDELITDPDWQSLQDFDM
jgi:uncharacterized membrane protein HdeD (DUF308 family)